MKQLPKLRPSAWDGLIVLLVLALAIACGITFWGENASPDELTVVVSVEGEEVERLRLADLPDGNGLVYSNNGYTLQIGLSYPIYPDMPCVRVVHSDCPTQDCVHTGEISRSGQSIVCLPARIIIQLEGDASDSYEPDIVIG